MRNSSRLGKVIFDLSFCLYWLGGVFDGAKMNQSVMEKELCVVM